MKLFIDTANVEEIHEIASWGILSGVTTNPSLVAKEGRNFDEVLKEIVKIVDGPISAEVISTKAVDMALEGIKLSRVHKNIVIKIPMTEEGLKAVKILSEKEIKTNVTLIFSANQALIAARAGASFVSPFVGRMDDIGNNGMDLIKDIGKIFSMHKIPTEIIAASIRHPMHVTDAALSGAHIATIPYKILKQIIKHPLTDKGIEKFAKDWNSMKDKVK